MLPSHIALTSSHIHHSDEPKAIIFIQVLALSHRAQVFNIEAVCWYGMFTKDDLYVGATCHSDKNDMRL